MPTSQCIRSKTFPVCALTVFALMVFAQIMTPIAVAESSQNPICENTVVLTGFWPPSNEMLRPWSTSETQNPQGWMGKNWRGLGYDVHSFFPEFPPDGDPTDNAIGERGSVGAVGSDFQVDYQDASADFWRIMDTYQPRILITTSRGGDIGWELESREGGHSSWISDRFGQFQTPTSQTIDNRSTEAIEHYADGVELKSTLPLEQLKSALIGINPRVDVQIDDHTSGNYLSGFVGLHGVYYHHTQKHNVAAGHIHVGREINARDAYDMMQHTLDLVLRTHPPCLPN